MEYLGLISGIVASAMGANERSVEKIEAYNNAYRNKTGLTPEQQLVAEERMRDIARAFCQSAGQEYNPRKEELFLKGWE